MMHKRFLPLWLGLIGVTAGCQFLPGNGRDPDPSELISEISVAREAPSVANGSVRVRTINRSQQNANIRVTMRVAGERVFFANRSLPSGGTDLLIGPDRADSVLVEADVAPGPAKSLPAKLFFLNTDFRNGDTLLIEIAAPAPPPDDSGEPVKPMVTNGNSGNTNTNQNNNTNGNSNSNTNNSPPPPGVTTIDPDGVDVIPVGPGDVVVVETPGQTPPGSVTTPPSQQADNSNTGADTVGVVVPGFDFDPTVGEMTQVVYAHLSTAASDPAPDLVFDCPLPGTTLRRGEPLVIGWAGRADNCDATIEIFLDRDGEWNGNELIVRSGVSEDDLDDRSVVVDTSALQTGTYIVGGLIQAGTRSTLLFSREVRIID